MGVLRKPASLYRDGKTIFEAGAISYVLWSLALIVDNLATLSTFQSRYGRVCCAFSVG